VGRSPASELTASVSNLRQHISVILDEAISGVNAGRLVTRALDRDIVNTLRGATAVDVIAAGKAAAAMLGAFVSFTDVPLRTMLAIGPRRVTPSADLTLPPGTEWCDAGHPLPDEGSLAGARRALEIAADAGPDDLLLVLLSGGGSALMALPAAGLTLDVKQRTARTLMEQSADIYELNTVRKHLSAIKGGRLAAAARGSVLTLALSDVIGDDLSVIASGPTVPDDSTFSDALEVLSRRGGFAVYPPAAVAHLNRGMAAAIAETPKRGDPRLARSSACVIGPQRGAIEGARRAAETLGYHVHVVPEPVTGEARTAATLYIAALSPRVASLPRPLCIISSGETTVTVVGRGKGGRNQEFALSLSQALNDIGPAVVAASIGTDGIDGPTDAAGAVVDSTTLSRAAASGLPPADTFLHENNAYAFFDRLGDLIRTGPTSTNVGDLQVMLVGN
jgi:hydroxypyruvate reductase